MPKTIPNYSNCKIYKIISNETDDIYIGSTSQKYLCNRLVQHKQDYKRYLGGKFGYISSIEILKYSDAKIILLQAYPECKSKEEQRMREQEWLDKLECVNNQRAYRTEEYKKEYYKGNANNYYKNNKDEILKRKNSKIECDVCNKKIARTNIAGHKKRVHKDLNP